MTEYILEAPFKVISESKLGFKIVDATGRTFVSHSTSRVFLDKTINAINIVYGEITEFEEWNKHYISPSILRAIMCWFVNAPDETIKDITYQDFIDALDESKREAFLVNAAKLKGLENELAKYENVFCPYCEGGCLVENRTEPCSFCEATGFVNIKKAHADEIRTLTETVETKINIKTKKLTAERGKLQEKLNVLSKCVKNQVESDKELKQMIKTLSGHVQELADKDAESFGIIEKIEAENKELKENNDKDIL